MLARRETAQAALGGASFKSSSLARRGAVSRLVSRAAERVFARLRARGDIPLSIELWDGTRIPLGASPRVTMRLPDAAALRILARPNFANLGEAFVEGRIELEGSARDILAVAHALTDASERASQRTALPAWLRAHTRKLDREAIRYHYDVSNDFYQLFLDAQLVYSCAYFVRDTDTLEHAQAAKLDHICRKLLLAPGERFLDVGCGWGALVIHAAKHYGARCVGITLSNNQFAYARQRVEREGLADRVEVRLQDYRDVPEREHFDKIASVGMFEHVGFKNLPTYFARLRELLKPGGVVLNHGITSTDPQSRAVGCGASEFIDRYVFPNGELPHLSRVIHDMGLAALEVMDIETLRLHYAKTLEHWSDRLEAKLDAASSLVDAKTLRIWRVYLMGCAMAFKREWISIHQVLAVKAQDAARAVLPATRDYMYVKR